MKISLIDQVKFDELLIKKGFSKKALSEATKLSQPTIINICKNKRNPSPVSAKKITDVLKVEFDDVFKIEG